MESEDIIEVESVRYCANDVHVVTVHGLSPSELHEKDLRESFDVDSDVILARVYFFVRISDVEILDAE